MKTLYHTCSENICGWCCYHQVGVTVKQLKQKGCLAKNCQSFKRNEQHSYWAQRASKKRKKHARLLAERINDMVIDIHTEALLHLLPAKSGENGSHLPLWMHLKDTAAAMEYLCQQRVSDSVIRACGLERREFEKISIFLAMTHDIGKATPLFAARITERLPFRKSVLQDNGLEILPLSAFLNADKSPHALAGEAVLKACALSCDICSIVGAHHGKPTDTCEYTKNQLETYPFNYGAAQKELWTDLRSLILHNALIQADYRNLSELPRLTNCAQMLLCGLLIQADWIASNQHYFPLLSAEEEGDSACYPARSDAALAALALPACWQAAACTAESDRLLRRASALCPTPCKRARPVSRNRCLLAA